jgi:hypothetical protein
LEINILRGTKPLHAAFKKGDPGASLARNNARPSARIEAKHSAAVLAARAVLAASVAVAVLASVCDPAGAARIYGSVAEAAKVAVEKRRKEPVPPPKGPLQTIVSIADQQISVYSGDVLIARSAVSTGVSDHPTPMGVFTVIQKKRWHRSNLYSAAPMPYMQRITWSGVALHAGVLPGYPASHGCIRLTEDFAIRLWQLTKLGNRVIIARNDVAPIEISHPQLFGQKRKPDAAVSLDAPAQPLKTEQAATIATPGDFIRRVKATAPLEPATPGQPAATEGGTKAEPKPPAAKVEPISIFISRKQGKLLVRQGFNPLFESAVTIRNPERPLGTHVFTAIEHKENAGAMRWTVVSFPDESASKIERIQIEPTRGRSREHETRRKRTAQPPRSVERASAALERIEIPPEAADRIGELLSPKSSLIISDHTLSEETDSDTDFIVLVR